MDSIFQKDKTTVNFLLTLFIYRQAPCYALTQILPLKARPRQSIQILGLCVMWYHVMQIEVSCSMFYGLLSF